MLDEHQNDWTAEIAILRAEIEHLTEQCCDREAIKVQLIEVVRTIERLDKQGHPIPDDLRKLKIDLVMKDEVAQRAVIGLERFSEELCSLVCAIDSELIGKQKIVLDKIPISGKNKKKDKFPRTGQADLRRCLIAALKDLGGSAQCNVVKDRMRVLLTRHFMPGDLIKQRNGEIVWEHYAHEERNALVREGLLKRDSPRGIWEFREDNK